jgi:cytochrome b subunit of formate dehydrogenase
MRPPWTVDRRCVWGKWVIVALAVSFASLATAKYEIGESVHGFLDCEDCHAAEFLEGEAEPAVDCAACHDEVVAEYAASSHGRLHGEGVSEAPACVTCHGPTHDIVSSSDPASPVHPTRLVETCGACHADAQMVEKFGIPVAQPVAAYSASVHARALAREEKAPGCSGCHGSHGILPASDPDSLVHHQRVPETCGGCHAEIAAAFAESVHGKAAAHGAREAPVCTDCHGEHRILSPEEPGSPVFATNLPKMNCGRCHADLRLGDKYGFDVDTVSAYADSYHGLASRAGAVSVANCASCHGVHDIRPSSDPASHVHEANLPTTCGSCHPGAGERFAIGPVHVLTEAADAHPAVFWVRRLYLALIYASVAGMLLHNFLDLRRKFKSPPVVRRPVEEARERMSLGFRLAHGTLAVSFGVLVYTGFALTYPESWWAAPLQRWEASLGLRGWVHRASAVVMLVAFAGHFLHLVFSRPARRCIGQMVPRRVDWHEFRERLAWYLGRRRQPPEAPWLGYPEKIEYLAMIWGTLVMALTGVYLWLDDLVLRWFPKWMADVATVVHFYEAVLASLAILVWHFYFVIFDPVVYPMDTAWLDGRSAPGREAERAQK